MNIDLNLIMQGIDQQTEVIFILTEFMSEYFH